MARKTSKPKSKRNFLSSASALVMVAAVVLLLAGGAWAWHAHHSKKDQGPAIPTNGNPKTPTKNYVNLSPPTSQDQQNNQANKQALVDSGSGGTPTNADGKKAVTVIVTSATSTSINGYVSGVFENGGTCTATLTNSTTGQTKTLTSSGFENASYTSCTPMHPSLSGSGWSVVLSYSSSSAEGSSASEKVQ